MTEEEWTRTVRQAWQDAAEHGYSIGACVKVKGSDLLGCERYLGQLGTIIHERGPWACMVKFADGLGAWFDLVDLEVQS